MNAEREHLKEVVADVLKIAKRMGADAAEAGISHDVGLSVTVRLGEVESIEFTRNKALGLTIYKDQKKGFVSTTDIHKEALQSSIEAACRIAEFTEADPASGLADRDRMALQIPNLDLYYPWQISTDEAIQWAKECEASARAFDTRIVNSEGANFSTYERYRIYGNSHGFIGAYPTTRHGLSCTVIAQSNNLMQRDYDFTVACDSRDLDSRIAVGQKAALRTLRRLNARKIKTCEAPVIFSAEIAGGLFGHFISAISGGNLFRKSSFLVDHLGKQIFPKFMHIEENPHLKKGLGSAPFDQEGVATEQHDIVREGVLQSYVLSSYSARRLGLKSTGNCGGVHNLMISHSNYDLPELLKEMGTGLLVTELMGHGINIVTGDYSRGAAGFWIEKGEIQYPVHEITIAGNLRDMFARLVAVGADTDYRGNILTGSVWCDQMTIAGA